MWDEIKLVETLSLLIAEYNQQITSDEILNYLQLHLVMQGINFHFVKKCIYIGNIQNKIMRQLLAYMELGKCYANAEFASDFFKRAKIVLGYWYIDKPVEHAWIKSGDTYYDPTYQSLFKPIGAIVKGYYPVAELTKDEYCKLKEITPENSQPGLKMWFKSIGIDYSKLTVPNHHHIWNKL